MKNKNRILSLVMISGLTLAFLGQSTEAEAWFIKWGEYPAHYEKHQTKQYKKYPSKHQKKHRSKYRKNKQYSHSPRAYGEIAFGLPHGYITVRVGGKKYYHHHGHYYRRHKHGYEVIPAPIGACIRTLPYGYQTVYFNGQTYYAYNDVYYRYTPQGYMVINKPHKNYPGHNAGSVYISADIYDQMTINIPNELGGYTPVILKRSGEGFVGPQGEYYPDFPKVAQLKVIYGN